MIRFLDEAKKPDRSLLVQYIGDSDEETPIIDQFFDFGSGLLHRGELPDLVSFGGKAAPQSHPDAGIRLEYHHRGAHACALFADGKSWFAYQSSRAGIDEWIGG